MFVRDSQTIWPPLFLLGVMHSHRGQRKQERLWFLCTSKCTIVGTDWQSQHMPRTFEMHVLVARTNDFTGQKTRKLRVVPKQKTKETRAHGILTMSKPVGPTQRIEGNRRPNPNASSKTDFAKAIKMARPHLRISSSLSQTNPLARTRPKKTRSSLRNTRARR
jgi:hypothetical protein